MSGYVLTDCFISIDGTDFTGQGTKAAITYSATAVDQTAFGDGTQKNAPGIKSWSMSFEFNGDEATTGVFFDKVGTEVPIIVRPQNDVVSPSNPNYTGQGLITEYSPLDGAVGDNHKVTLSVVSAGPLTRDTVGS